MKIPIKGKNRLALALCAFVGLGSAVVGYFDGVAEAQFPADCVGASQIIPPCTATGNPDGSGNWDCDPAWGDMRQWCGCVGGDFVQGEETNGCHNIF